eukprot:9019422-Lingulodinium_polyedra.AAC.1
MLQKLFLQERQFGVLVPGGAEALVHARLALEKVSQEGGAGPLAVLVLDLRNAFPSIEWSSIRAQ